MFWSLLLLFTLLFTLLPQRTFAQSTSGTWIDRMHISYNNMIFTNDNIKGGIDKYTWKADPDGGNCYDYIDSFSSNNSKAKYHPKNIAPAPSNQCVDGAVVDITLATTGVNIFFYLDRSRDQVITVNNGVTGLNGENPLTYSHDTANGYYSLDGDATCTDTISIPTAAGGQPTLTVRIPEGSGVTQAIDQYYNDQFPFTLNDLFYDSSGAFIPNHVGGCLVSTPVPILMSFTPPPAPDGSPTTGVSSGGASGTTSTGNLALECNISLNPLSWFICPLVKLAVNAVQSLDGEIKNQLTIDADKYFSNDPANSTAQGFYKVWNTIRVMSLILLVAIALIMIISQSIGIGPFDAYTVRKVLPRLAIAVIAITLSWDLVRLAVTFSNDLGRGIGDIIMGPFRSLPNAETSVKGFLIGDVGLIGALFAGADALFVLSLAITAFLAVMTAFIIITFRNILAIFLAVLVPFAILCWILPGTRKAWKLWYDNFLAMLLVFPIITGFIAAGRVFAVVSSQPPDGSSFFNQIVTFIAYFGPYFALPVAFRLAGGAIATVGGLANDRSRGVFDRLKKGRQARQAKNIADWRAGDRFKGTKYIPGSRSAAKAFNFTGHAVSAGRKGHYGIGERGRQHYAGMLQAGGESWLKENPNAAKTMISQDDTTAVMAFSGASVEGAKAAANDLATGWKRSTKQSLIDAGWSDDAAEREAETRTERRKSAALSSAMALGINQRSTAAALNMVAQNKSRAVEDGDWLTVQRGISRLAGRNDQLSQDLSYGYQYNSRTAGRMDLGGDWTGDKVSTLQRDVDQQVDSGAISRAEGDKILRTRGSREVMVDAIGRTGMNEFVRGYTSSVKELGSLIKDDFASGDMERVKRAAMLTSELQANKTYATGKNRDATNQLFEDLHIDTRGNIDEQLAQMVTERRVSSSGTLVVAPYTADELRNDARVFGGSQRDIDPTTGRPYGAP